MVSSACVRTCVRACVCVYVRPSIARSRGHEVPVDLALITLQGLHMSYARVALSYVTVHAKTNYKSANLIGDTGRNKQYV